MAGLSYRGAFTADVCLQWNNRTVVHHNVSFGKMPIMVKVCMYVCVCDGKNVSSSYSRSAVQFSGLNSSCCSNQFSSAALTDFSTSNMFLFCVSSFTVQCVPFAGFG
jgi:hypothetical protein